MWQCLLITSQCAIKTPQNGQKASTWGPSSETLILSLLHPDFPDEVPWVETSKSCLSILGSCYNFHRLYIQSCFSVKSHAFLWIGRVFLRDKNFDLTTFSVSWIMNAMTSSERWEPACNRRFTSVVTDPPRHNWKDWQTIYCFVFRKSKYTEK